VYLDNLVWLADARLSLMGASSISSRSNRRARVLVIMGELTRLWPSPQRGQPLWLLPRIEGGGQP